MRAAGHPLVLCDDFPETGVGVDAERQRREVDENDDAFQRVLATLLPKHRDRYALMKDREIVEIFDRPGEADIAGMKRFEDGIFSIQEVTDEPTDLGFFSHVAH